MDFFSPFFLPMSCLFTAGNRECRGGDKKRELERALKGLLSIKFHHVLIQDDNGRVRES